MHSMIELHPTPDALDGLGLPAIPYPVALPAFQSAVNDGELPLADMLHGLQLRAAQPAAHWRRMEPAMARLAELLAPDDARGTVVTEGADWWLEVGPVDLGDAVVTLQRGDSLLAALAPRGEGGLRMAGYHPLDGQALKLLLSLASASESVAGQAVIRSPWERAQEAAADAAQAEAREEGLTFVAFWPRGLRRLADQTLPEWEAQAQTPPRRAACVAAEIGIFDLLRGAAR